MAELKETGRLSLKCCSGPFSGIQSVQMVLSLSQRPPLGRRLLVRLQLRLSGQLWQSRDSRALRLWTVLCSHVMRCLHKQFATGTPSGGKLELQSTHPRYCLLSGCGDGAGGVASAFATDEANKVRSHSAVRLAAAHIRTHKCDSLK